MDNVSLSYKNFIFISKTCLLIGNKYPNKYSKLIKNGDKNITYKKGIKMNLSNNVVKINKSEFEVLRDLFYS